MGVEVMVLSMLATPAMTRWEVPEKYHSTYFVIDMLVSCRHRFQKPNAAFFWSKQSEAILMCTFRQSANLTRLVLPLANDMMLKSIAVHCRLEKNTQWKNLILEFGICFKFVPIPRFFRHLLELEIQLSLDATEEGLLALAGRSAQQRDQGFHKPWDNALYIHKVVNYC